jgi:hypothetical protein
MSSPLIALTLRAHLQRTTFSIMALQVIEDDRVWRTRANATIATFHART